MFWDFMYKKKLPPLVCTTSNIVYPGMARCEGMEIRIPPNPKLHVNLVVQYSLHGDLDGHVLRLALKVGSTI